MHTTKTKQHVPVLAEEVLDVMKPKKGEGYLDLTAGYGGHAKSVLEITSSSAVLVDRDMNAVDELKNMFEQWPNVSIMHEDFFQACKNLRQNGDKFDLILVDLGVSSPHLDKASRGFSLSVDGPLDMRMDESQDLTAEKVVNTYAQEYLEKIIREYGEEPKARLMAKLIIESRPLKNTHELASIAKKVWPGNSRVHPATRLFQAIRIEVNDELKQLEQSLPIMVDLLSPGGRLGIISFHSLEDRIVKRFFKEKTGDRYDSELIELTKKPLSATQNELDFNPRSRSAKIRVVAKINTKKKGQG